MFINLLDIDPRIINMKFGSNMQAGFGECDFLRFSLLFVTAAIYRFPTDNILTILKRYHLRVIHMKFDPDRPSKFGRDVV